MNRSFVVLAGATFIVLALLLSTQISAPAKISAPASQKQPHRVAVQVNVCTLRFLILRQMES